MVKLYDTGVFLIDGKTIIEDNENAGRAMTEAKGKTISKEEAAKNKESEVKSEDKEDTSNKDSNDDVEEANYEEK